MTRLHIEEQITATEATGDCDSKIQGVVIGTEHLEVITQASGSCGVAGRSKTHQIIASQPETEKDDAILTSFVQAAVTTLSIHPSLLQPMDAPPLVTGDQIENYTITETIVQGWLYKKGTGGDWVGRRWWKPRWVTLALAENQHTIVPAPILLSHRAPGVPYPVNIIELTESTVIMAVEHGETTKKGAKHQPHTPPKDEWNRHCFRIVHAQHQDNESTPKTTTRIFTAPVEERNEWVFATNNTLLGYVRRLSKARSDAAKQEAARQSFRAPQNNKDAWRWGYERSILVDGVEGEQWDQKQQWPRQHWTNSGRSRMRSPSPVRERACMGRPPTSPQSIRSVRSMDSLP
eukprot:CAMPEP_0172526774 /NCGR_PEP_ID=MMETSP1067-20121228/1613_1 /TAXON_ID=265564 ORGANISM="Thalassiosira punctigera, Strain Tpunct2005C2" /NCGR_SAMPLE_ID=MMETSP1067 /ASSEMBLY_ACC=CAM_ASM_000444 /LENGTH=346 /DNA_ID=CAMNT_0013310353 /DNA_START=44 /DNA_END=1084 /DNA_ORIENTATION=-